MILPILLIGMIFLVVIKSKIDKKTGRRICRTFVGLFIIAYVMNTRFLLLNVLSFVLLLLLLVPKNSSFFKKMVEKDEEKSGMLNGLIIYVLMMMLTILVFPLWIAGCCLINLSFADGLASFVGEKGKKRLPWNKKKTLEGSLTFLLVSFVGCFLVMMFLSTLSLDRIFLLTLTTSLIASFVESLSIRMDDNVSVPLITGIVLYLIS